MFANKTGEHIPMDQTSMHERFGVAPTLSEMDFLMSDPVVMAPRDVESRIVSSEQCVEGATFTELTSTPRSFGARSDGAQLLKITSIPRSLEAQASSSTLKQHCEDNQVSPDKRAQDVCNTSTESSSSRSSGCDDSLRSTGSTDSEGESESGGSGVAVGSGDGQSSRTDDDDEGYAADDDDAKPPHSYIALISMALLESEEKKLLLGDIYAFIQERFAFYRNATDKAWRNSIRHNLSLNECFIKAGRADNGKGNYWAVHPACVDDFKKGDFRRRHARRRARRSHQKHVSQLPLTYRATMGYVQMTSVPAGPKMAAPPQLPPYGMTSYPHLNTNTSASSASLPPSTPFYAGPTRQDAYHGATPHSENHQHIPTAGYYNSQPNYLPTHAPLSSSYVTSGSQSTSSYTPSYTARYGTTSYGMDSHSACVYSNSNASPYPTYHAASSSPSLHHLNSTTASCFRDTTNTMSRDVSSSFSSLPATTYNYISAIVESSLNTRDSPLGFQSQSALHDALAGLHSLSNL